MNELEEISVVTKEGKHIILIKDGRFILPGTEILNELEDITTTRKLTTYKEEL